ncbi:MAG: acyltransferase family protein [Bacteroides sp.]|nr:acyltransferase family protein [Bacteroides sp.]MCM1447162.1 acyltransferase family protein [Bacteroides sp.]
MSDNSSNKKSIQMSQQCDILPKIKIRQSNIELLRIISMFFVMLTHATLAVGYPDQTNAMGMEYYLLGVIKALSVVSVNVFVMISGWFGIKFSIKGILSFLFQVLFFSILGFIIAIIANIKDFSISNLMTDGLLLGSRNYWFVDCYLLLYIFSPVLNSFCENSPKKQFKLFLITAFCIQSLAAWVFPTLSTEIKAGYSTISFILIYMLTRYVRIYQPVWASLRGSHDVIVYLVLTIILSFVAFFSHGGIIAIIGFFSYASPFVIAASVFLLLGFSKFRFQSNLINWVASSCFAVYLLHEHVSIRLPLYRSTINHLYYTRQPFITGTIDVVLFILSVWGGGILLDKGRMCIYNLLLKIYRKNG